VAPAENKILLLIALVGVSLVIAVLLKAGLKRIGIPALVGYILFGLVVHSADLQWNLFSAGEDEVLDFLLRLGLFPYCFASDSKVSGMNFCVNFVRLVWFG
jgi:Kef-type K+ transport system membrane component KefB